MEEIWKDVVELEGKYLISNLGNLKSIIRKVPKILITTNNKGYLYISRKINNTYKIFAIHRLVATAFIPNIENKPQVNHVNGVKTDNRVTNLEWCTKSENIKHGFKIGLISSKGDKSNRRILDSVQVEEIRHLLEKGAYTQAAIAQKYKVGAMCISDIKLNKTWCNLK